MNMTLDQLRPGQQAVITDLSEDMYLKQRLMAYGMTPGTTVCCRYKSPDGSVTSLECRGSVIALRTGDMKRIWGRWECRRQN